MKIEDLRNTKIYLSDVEDRIKFQEKVFRLGIEWSDGSHFVDKSMSSNTFFTINEFLDLFIYCGNISFISKKRKQIFLEDVLAIEEPKEECKFKPFDKVLVVNSSNVWVPRFFSRYDGEDIHPFETTDGSCYKTCIPYEGNEELANTTKNPE